MGAKNKVVAGDYAGCLVFVFRSNLAIQLEGFSSYPISKDTLESYKVVNQETIKGDILKGLVGETFLGPAGMVAGVASKKGIYTLILNFKDGKRNLVEIDEKRFKVFQKAMFEANLDADERKAETQCASDADELMKWKSLLDQGVITAEEFEGKKKQLLGL